MDRSKAQKKVWKKLKKQPKVDDDELLDVIYTVIDRGYTDGPQFLSAKQMLKIWGSGVRLAFIPSEIRRELKSREFQYHQVSVYFDKKIEEFVQQKKLRLTPTKMKGYQGNKLYYFVRRPKE